MHLRTVNGEREAKCNYGIGNFKLTGTLQPAVGVHTALAQDSTIVYTAVVTSFEIEYELYSCRIPRSTTGTAVYRLQEYFSYFPEYSHRTDYGIGYDEKSMRSFKSHGIVVRTAVRRIPQ